MAVEVKRHHKHGHRLGLAVLAMAIGLGSLLYSAPTFLAAAAHSLVSPAVHVQPAANGLAKISLGSQTLSAQPGLGQANNAGQHLEMQLLLEATR